MKRWSGIVPFGHDKNSLLLKDKRVLVTGAAGHLGAHLCASLIERGADVIALASLNSDLSRLEPIRDRVKVIRADIRDVLWVGQKEFLGGVQIVFHLAAAGIDPRHRRADLMMATNVQGTLNALEAAREWKVERFVYCGSCAQYSGGRDLGEDALIEPVSEYGVSKAAGELLARAFFKRYALAAVCVRPFLLYGPMESSSRVMTHAIVSALKGIDIGLSDGNQSRDWVYVADAVDALLCAGTVVGIEGEVFNISSGCAYTIREVVEEVLRQVPGSSKPLFGVLSRRAEDVDVLMGDPQKALRILGWKAQTSLEQGIARTIEWVRQQSAVGGCQ